ncbi:hypothetical protein K1718_26690 [Roseibium porphyridii]|uniref:Uncharacterized protein n=1 Tax=Roseibium porphyridii TaxID=2866279 RepID=A0ABY8F2Q2_9HYPH|nr:hypothetical protein [Roseibium sp. KMA01]WFE89699.1 hypothetical protein K1718_26690 [Roseibium sp. KMA01]
MHKRAGFPFATKGSDSNQATSRAVGVDGISGGASNRSIAVLIFKKYRALAASPYQCGG